MGGGEFVGRVVSNRMQKTVVVAISHVVWCAKYMVYERRTGRHMAHDEKQECVTGDVVRINATRKLSKHKSYNVTQVLRKAHVYEPRAAAELVAQRDASKPDDWVALARSKLQDTTARLAALRKLYAEQVGAGVGIGGGVLSSGVTPAAALGSSPGSSHTEVLSRRGQGLHLETTEAGASSSSSSSSGGTSGGSDGGSSRSGGGQDSSASDAGSTAHQVQHDSSNTVEPIKGSSSETSGKGKGKGGGDWPWPVSGS